MLENTFVNEDYNIIFHLGAERPKCAFKLVLVGPEEKVVGIHTMVGARVMGREVEAGCGGGDVFLYVAVSGTRMCPPHYLQAGVSPRCMHARAATATRSSRASAWR